MHKVTKLAVAVGGVALATAASVAGSAPASAAPQQAPDQAGAAVVRLPAHSDVAAPATAHHPTISPSVTVTHGKSGTYTCYKGTLCTTVWDPVLNEWAIFHLYNCRTYSLSNWLGTGNYYDNQTGGVRSYFYGSSGNVLKSFTSGYNVSQNWDPVYKIKNC